MFKWFKDWMDKRRRIIDMKILWPSCKRYAPNMDRAKAAFLFHIMHDLAWTDHYTDLELALFVEELS